MTFKEKHEAVKKVFNHVFEGYVLKDIENLLSIKPDEDGYGGCSAPLAMTCFATINRLGFLTSKRKKLKELELKQSLKCLKEFCNDWMKIVNTFYGKSVHQDLLGSIFRNGLAHQFLSSGHSAVTRNPKFTCVVSKLEDGTNVLQSEILAQNVISVIKELGKYLRDENNKALIQRYHDRWVKQESRDLLKLKQVYKGARKEKKNRPNIPIIKWTDLDLTISGQPMPPSGTSRYDLTTISGSNLNTTITA